MKRNKMLKGRFDNQTASEIAEVETLQDTFKISVKDDEDNEVYSNDKEPYEYKKVPSLATALELFGATLTDDQKQFLEEALKGSKETGEAVAKIITTINDDLRVSAKNNQYQKVFNAHKPLSEENIFNGYASMVRNFVKTGSVSDETAIETLKSVKALPTDYTVQMYRSNKGKR